jgi:TolA-binding protein
MPKDQQQHSLKYLDYIENCLSYLDHKQYKQAKEGFDALLKFYTDDVNAQFYGAMTRYRAGEYGSAIELFKLTEINAIRAFREDAKFYRAMSMKALGKTSEAKVLFDEIITADGAYAKRAKQESGQ